MKKLLLFSSLVVFIVTASPLPGHCDYKITCIGPGGTHPDINSQGHVVWEAEDPPGGDLDIFHYDGAATSQVTTNDANDALPLINNAGQIAWLGRGTAFPSREQAHFFNGSTIQKLTDDNWDKYNLGLNSQGEMVWDARNTVDGNDYEIFFYNGAVQRLTTNVNGLDDYNPRINDSGELVWQGKVGNALQDFEIFFYDGAVQQLTNDGEHQVEPDINSSGHLVWSGVEPGVGYDIFYDDGNTVTNLTNDGTYEIKPRMNDLGHVVWLRQNGPSYDLYRYDGAAVAPLASTVDVTFGHDIGNGGHVAWAADDGGDWDIFVFDGITTTQLTNDGSDDIFPRVNDSGAVVWQSADNGICLAEPVVAPVPAIYYPATGKVDIPEVLIAGSAKAYAVILQQLGGPGRVFQLDSKRKTAPTGNTAATYYPATGILEITLLEVDGMARTWRVQLLRQAGGGYVFKLLKAKPN